MAMALTEVFTSEAAQKLVGGGAAMPSPHPEVPNAIEVDVITYTRFRAILQVTVATAIAYRKEVSGQPVVISEPMLTAYQQTMEAYREQNVNSLLAAEDLVIALGTAAAGAAAPAPGQGGGRERRTRQKKAKSRVHRKRKGVKTRGKKRKRRMTRRMKRRR